MHDGNPVIDVHQHVVPVDSLRMTWERWAPPKVTGLRRAAIYRDDGVVDPARYLAHLDDQGIDVALLLAEYSPRVTGVQAIEDLVPLRDAAPERVGLIAALNPHLHFPADAELDRQLGLGAVAVKLHPVHGDFARRSWVVYRLDRVPALAASLPQDGTGDAETASAARVVHDGE